MGKYLNFLLSFSKKKHSLLFRIVSLLFGAILFLVIVPLILIKLAGIISAPIGINWPRPVETVIVFASVALGLIFLIWSVASQWFIGKGTPSPVAPTQRLIVVGPYRLCRNPLQLGVILYYLGLGTFLGSLTVGLVSFMIGLIIGSLYYRFVEEKELLIRFGDEYKKYRKETPFLIQGYNISGVYFSSLNSIKPVHFSSLDCTRHLILDRL